MRDFRINRIFEGSSEIMRLFIAREAVDTHLQVAGDLIKPGISTGEKIGAMLKAGAWYAGWLPGKFFGRGQVAGSYGEFGINAKHLRYVERTSRKLARSMFFAMGKYQAKLERKQALLGRFVDIGAELYAISAAVVRAHALRDQANGRNAVRMADVFSRRARLRIRKLFADVNVNADDATYRLAQEVLEGKHVWLEEGAISAVPAGSVAPAASAPRERNVGERVATQVGASG